MDKAIVSANSKIKCNLTLLNENLLFSSTLSTIPTIEWDPIWGSFLPTPLPGRMGPFLIWILPILYIEPKQASIAKN